MKKKESTELQMKNVHKMAKQWRLKANQSQNLRQSRKRNRSSTFPVNEETTPNVIRRNTYSDTTGIATNNVSDNGVTSPAEQEDSTNSYEETKF